MRILVVGGGSGGHITPALAVTRELFKLKPRAKIEFWTDRASYKNVVKNTTEMIEQISREDQNVHLKTFDLKVRKLFSGKFHRYANWELKDYFENLDITTKDLIAGNISGFCGFSAGVTQSLTRLLNKNHRPDAIFLKGGFVSLPVGVAAEILHIPYVIHESDAVPGLANRLLMEKAKVIALGVGGVPVPKNSISTVVGIPVSPKFRPVSQKKHLALKKTLGFKPEKPLLIVTGGSQGSENINNAIRDILPELLNFTSVGLIAGKKHYASMLDLKKYEIHQDSKLTSDFRLWETSSNMDELLGAADIVVSRAGATTIAELASLKKTVVLVPFEKLPGGHQVKNAERLVAKDAALMVLDNRMYEQPGILLKAVQQLIANPNKAGLLAKNLHSEANPRAAKDLAHIVLDVANHVPLNFKQESSHEKR